MTNEQILTQAEQALSRFATGKPVLPVMNKPAGPDCDDIKIQKALALLKEFLEATGTKTEQERYGKEL